MKTLLLTAFVAASLVALAHGEDPGVRTNTVTVGIEKQLKKKYADITAADLKEMTELSLPHIHLPSFGENDFAGMPKLKKLTFFSLFHKNNKGESTPAFDGKVFAKLSALEELVIYADQLGNLPDDAFAGLTSLKILELRKVTMNRLPKSLLTLPKIEAFYYDGAGLPPEEFAQLKEKLGDKLKPTRPK